MSLSVSIIVALEIVGMISGGVLGYSLGDTAKKSLCNSYPVLEGYRKKWIEPRFKGSQISEDTSAKVVGAFVGVFLGYKAWFISTPVCILKTANDNPDEFKKIKEFFRK